MKFKPVMRWDERGRLFRVCRFVWTRGVIGDNNGYSAKLSLALVPHLWRFQKEYAGWWIWFLGLRVHYKRAYGGTHD